MGIGGTGDLCRLPRLDQRDQGASSGARQLTGRERDSVQYGVSSLSDLAPDRALALLRGHWEIENRLFYVKDDGFGEDRQVLQNYHSGLVMSLLLGAGLTCCAASARSGQTANPSPAEHNASQPIPQQHSHHPTTDFERALVRCANELPDQWRSTRLFRLLPLPKHLNMRGNRTRTYAVDWTALEHWCATGPASACRVIGSSSQLA